MFMKAYVGTDSYRSRTRITNFLRKQGFRVRAGRDRTELYYFGESPAVTDMLHTLKYRYPKGYFTGWAMPDPKAGKP
jgi:hypothetical protein